MRSAADDNRAILDQVKKLPTVQEVPLLNAHVNGVFHGGSDS